MYSVSSTFATSVKNKGRQFLVKANIGGVDYLNTSIVSFDLETSLTLSEEFEIGNAILSKLTFKMRTQDTLPPNAKVIPYVALKDIPDEWIPLGEFYIDVREQVKLDVWQFTCYDKLVFADVPYVSSLTYPATRKAVWDEICTSLGFTYSGTLNTTYQFPVAPTGYSKREVLAYIAGLNCSSLYVGKDGVIHLKKFSAADTPVFFFGLSDYTRSKQTNPIKTFTKIVAVYDTETGSFYSSGTGDDDHTLYILNPFVTQQIVDDMLSSLNGFAYLPISMESKGFPQLEVGDTIEFDRNDSRSWVDTQISWLSANSPWTGTTGYQSIILHQVFEFRGGLKMKVEAPAKSKQKSEFKVDGSLSKQINDINKTSLKEARNYFGVTLTKEAGLVIERSDLASKAIFNSDQFSFQVGGVDKLFFDPVSGKYKFVGDIVMEGGSLIIGPGSTFSSGYDPTTKETPAGAQSKADAAEAAATSVANAAQTAADSAQATADNSVQQATDYNGVQISPTLGVKVSHSDGSYTQMKASGFVRHVGSTDKDYHYLAASGYASVDQWVGGSTAYAYWANLTSSPYRILKPFEYKRITLPSEFVGKSNIQVTVSFKEGYMENAFYQFDGSSFSYISSSGVTPTYFRGTICRVVTINSASGYFDVECYNLAGQNTVFDKSNDANWDDMFYYPCSFSWTALA